MSDYPCLWRIDDGEPFTRNEDGTYSMKRTLMVPPYKYTFERLMETGAFTSVRPNSSVIDSFSGEYCFLSNMYPHVIKYCGGLYPSAENAYQAAKTEPADRNGEWFFFLNLPPKKSKALGRKLPLRKGWEGMKDQVMREVLAIKFSDPFLEGLLLETGDAILIEGNWWNDQYWGVCNGIGKNKLGLELMYQRARIRLEKALN